MKRKIEGVDRSQVTLFPVLKARFYIFVLLLDESFGSAATQMTFGN